MEMFQLIMNASAEKIIFRPNDVSADDYCPITSFSAVPNRSIWYSKLVKQLAINVIRIQGSVPCKNELQIALHEKQSFFFAEMAKSVCTCF